MNTLVSIIVPLFNREDLIEETLLSLLNQTYDNIEIIIIDDHSTDNSFLIAQKIAKSSTKVRVYKRPSTLKKGANPCRNYGLSIANGDFVKWIDSDDLLDKNAIEIQLNDIHISKKDVSVCRSKKFEIQKENSKRKWLNEWGIISNEPSIVNFCFYKFIWHTCSGLWDIRFVRKNMSWDYELKNSQEWLFHLEAICKGVKISTVNEFLSFIRVHEGSMSDKSNKKSNYYYHECFARYKAIMILLKQRLTINEVYIKILKKMLWYHLFIFYKGNLFIGFKALRFYPILFFNLIKLIIT